MPGGTMVDGGAGREGPGRGPVAGIDGREPAPVGAWAISSVGLPTATTVETRMVIHGFIRTTVTLLSEQIETITPGRAVCRLRWQCTRTWRRHETRSFKTIS